MHGGLQSPGSVRRSGLDHPSGSGHRHPGQAARGHGRPVRRGRCRGRGRGARGATFTLFKESLAEVRLYARNKAAYDRAGLRDLSLSRADLEALIPVAEGRMPLIVTVNRAADILQVLRLGQEEGVRLILDGAAEGWLVADQIAAANVPVLLNPIMNLPGNLRAPRRADGERRRPRRRRRGHRHQGQ